MTKGGTGRSRGRPPRTSRVSGPRPSSKVQAEVSAGRATLGSISQTSSTTLGSSARSHTSRFSTSPSNGRTVGWGAPSWGGCQLPRASTPGVEKRSGSVRKSRRSSQAELLKW